ncbi:BatD family protein [Paracoccus ravus]|uniref:BatD family protein n=1 Tax=Paracoccus ravus TaxID=2447760 RepID=UPI00142FF7A6|nr:BatD family protein [Paracoccus ravus]
MRKLVFGLFLLFAAPLVAQEAATPIVETTLEQNEVVPGQSVTLRLTVLVPSWMPDPPELPSFEAPNLRVRQPPKSSTAVSRQVDGATWSGVSRRYLLTPMVPGQFALPPQTVEVTYIGPDGTSPVRASLQTEALILTGILPPGAEDLDPFIAADGLSLTQELSGPTTGLEPGASVIRTVTARIDGASPIVLPSMLPQVQIPAIKVYPSSPQVTEESGTDRLAGTRVESETLMALGGGEGTVPPVRIDWFNLASGKVESAALPGFEISVSGPPPASTTPRNPPDWRIMAALATGAVLTFALLRWIWPRARRSYLSWRETWRASEGYARKKLLEAISSRDYPASSHWLSEWRARDPALSSRAMAEISNRMASVGATIYRDPAGSDRDAAWRDLATAVRSAGGRRRAAGPSLPALNPQSPR